MREASVTIRTYKIPEELRGVDYTNNQEMRDKLKDFLEGIWKEKDQIIEREKEKYGIETVFNLFIALILFGCSVDHEEKINYEAEFYSIVSEFEESSILDFKRKDIDTNKFVEQFITKLDKQKIYSYRKILTG